MSVPVRLNNGVRVRLSRASEKVSNFTCAVRSMEEPLR